MTRACLPAHTQWLRLSWRLDEQRGAIVRKSWRQKYDSWDEGSQLKEYPYKITGGTGKYQGASGGGTYMYENLTDTLSGGTFKGAIKLQ